MFKRFYNLEMNKAFKKYIIIQYILVTVIPLLATIIFSINPYIKSPVDEFAFYSSGITGLIFMFILYLAGINNSFIGSIFILIKLALSFIILSKMYVSTKKTSRLYIINVALSLWCCIIGGWFMFISMQ